MLPHIFESFMAHAIAMYPAECCAFVVKTANQDIYWPCTNSAENPTADFRISAEEYCKAEDCGQIIAICHSHPDASSLPSDKDRAMCTATNMPWYILSWPEGDLRCLSPDVCSQSLYGRPFVHGVWDCYSAVKDWYQSEKKINLPEFSREDGWWETDQELYLDNFKSAGFSIVSSDDIQPGDGILMQIQSKRVNHAAVYLGNGRIFHHLYGRLSREDIYGGYWLRSTRLVVRHNSLIK